MDAESSHTILIRHGETEWSRVGRHTGWTDIGLSERGEDQARALAVPLRQWQFSAVFCSPLQRARKTSELAGISTGVHVDENCREWGYGDYESKTTAEIQSTRPGWSIWKDGVVGGESVDDVGHRADAVIARRNAIAGDVAIFAHGHFLRILTARWLGMAPAAGEHFALSTASISDLGYERDAKVVLRWNDTHHLDLASA